MPLATGKYDLCELAETFVNGMALSSGFRHEIHFKVANSEFTLNCGFPGSGRRFFDAIVPNASKKLYNWPLERFCYNFVKQGVNTVTFKKYN